MRGMAAAPDPVHQTHPTAQEQATPVSTNQNHHLGEKGLEQSTEAELRPQNISPKGQRRHGRRDLSWLHQAPGTRERFLISPKSSPPDTTSHLGQMFPLSLHYREMRIIYEVRSQEPVEVPGAAVERYQTCSGGQAPGLLCLILHTCVSGSWRTSGKIARPTD